MNIDYIAIGNELLNGKISDLNGLFLAKNVGKNRLKLRKIHIVPDQESEIFMAINEAFENSDVIVLSGGLGPTLDDITKPTLAKYFSKKLVEKTEHLELIRKIYQEKNRDYDTNHYHYHRVPEDFALLFNNVGYAPGLYYQNKSKQIFSLPGIPAEFQTMFSKEVLPLIKTSNSKFSKNITFKTWKIPESKIFKQVDPDLWSNLNSIGEVASLPHTYGVDIGVTIEGETENDLQIKEKKIMDILNSSKVSDSIYYIGNESLEEIIIQKAIEKNITFGFTESCTGGLLASRITDISGCSSVFWGSITAYDNSVKQNVLGVKEKTLIEHGAVSKETAFEMAYGARKQLGVDIVVSTTGIAGPGGGSKEKPVGTIGIGISSSEDTTSELYQFKGNRLSLKKRFSDYALFLLLEKINSLPAGH